MTDFTMFGHVAELVVAGTETNGHRFDQKFDISFEVNRSRSSEPNEATIEIYNLAENTRRQFDQEYKRVLLKAGYIQFSDVVFAGEIRKVEHIPDDNGILTRIEAADGVVAWTQAYINQSSSAGQPVETIIRQIVGQMPNVQLGRVIGFENATPFRRPFVMNGLARDALDTICRTYNARWTIQNGIVDVVRNDRAATTSSAVVLKPDTGLLSVETTEKGVTVLCLLNPAFKPNGVVQVVSPRINNGDPSNFRINALMFRGSTYGSDGFQAALECQRMAEDTVELEPSPEQAIKASATEITA